MRTLPPALCTLVAIALSFSSLTPSRGAGPVSVATPWLELHAARARLLAGPPAAEASRSYLAGFEVSLAEGWKTYWRTPGDAGVPPLFDWTGSSNAATIKVLYPAPHRMQEPGAQTIGYSSTVIFPIEVTPGDRGKPVELKLTVEFGICREICIPAEAKLSLIVSPQQLEG